MTACYGAVVSEQLHAVDPRYSDNAALAIVGGGLLALAFGWMRHSWALRVFGFVAVASGSALYARKKYTERDEKVEAAKTTVHAALDDLDPVAKAQVLADLADS
jgi:uncharacterized membrane protein